MDLAVELVLIGAECPEERAFGGSLGAALGAQRFWRAVTGTLLDAGPGRCRITTVHPEADANAMLSALKQAAARGGRLLLVYLAGQLAWDPRRRRPVLVAAGSLRENAARRGLSCDWVTSAMAHCGQTESLLVLDLAAEPAAWQEWPAWAAAELTVPAWGRIVRHDVPRRGRAPAEGGAGVLAEELAELLDAGVPGAPAVLDPAALDARLPSRTGHGSGEAKGAVHLLEAPQECRLLLRNRAVLRGSLRSTLT
ncbi:hypothetical protein ABIA32_003183 [Streptacidiphilus sp. MAP12-20]|uniref:hypothetical protein n=1 Tax=Streptacidiphilus sp. MAP12-20 TaxID=3156299 RepID=UPI00351257DF